MQSIGQQLLLIMADQSQLGYLNTKNVQGFLTLTPIQICVMANPAGATSVRRYLGECAMGVLQHVGDELLEIGQEIWDHHGPSIGGSTSI